MRTGQTRGDPGEETAYARVQSAGLGTASALDLLAVGIADDEGATPQAEAYVRRLFKAGGGLRRVADLSPADLQDLGMSSYQALRALAWMEIGRRAGGAGKGKADVVDGPEQVAALLDYLRNEKREHFVAILLDAKNVVLRTSTVHIGTLTTSIVAPREVFREAIRGGAASLIVAHNHPSGDPTPSPEDLEVTARLAEAGKLLDIPLLDHVVLGERDFVSLAQRGIL